MAQYYDLNLAILEGLEKHIPALSSQGLLVDSKNRGFIPVPAFAERCKAPAHRHIYSLVTVIEDPLLKMALSLTQQDAECLFEKIAVPENGAKNTNAFAVFTRIAKAMGESIYRCLARHITLKSPFNSVPSVYLDDNNSVLDRLKVRIQELDEQSLGFDVTFQRRDESEDKAVISTHIFFERRLSDFFKFCINRNLGSKSQYRVCRKIRETNKYDEHGGKK